MGEVESTDPGGMEDIFKAAESSIPAAEPEGGTPGEGAPASAPVPPSAAVFMKQIWPMCEKGLTTVGGDHFTLTEQEQTMWFFLMEAAYPEFDPGRFAKIAFWMVTIGIFAPKIVVSVGIAVGKARKHAAGTPDGDDNSSGKEG